HFTQSMVCTLLTKTGRITLSDHTLIETVGESRTEHALGSDSEVLTAYREKFGVVIGRLPRSAVLANDRSVHQSDGPHAG
ncbi:MAG TPA: arylamine N-acetyltransferase, partial [Candidatus Dormibacteraeota bacterium]|nr:arylamine N-acetyltransferase [Candidatus Dormibacteraeota bacterium]